MKPEGSRSDDWISPLLLFIPVSSVSAICGSRAEALQLPTAWLASSAAIWMLVLAWGSLVIPSRRWRIVVWLLGMACVAYGPLLLATCSTRIALSRKLNDEEVQVFRERFPVLVQRDHDSGAGLRVRRWEFEEAMKVYLRGIGALREEG